MDAASTNVVIGTNGDTQTVVVKNSKAGSLLIEKRDSVTDKPLEGVTFKITTTTGEFVPDESGAISSNGLYRTNASGQILLNGVVGTLIVTEEKTIPGYVIDESNRSQTVVVNPNDTQKLTFYNIPKNTLTIHKYATDLKSPLPGVKFSVTESGGSVVGPNNGVYITNESGQAVVQNLTPGETVIVREIETVDGYTLETVPQTILVKEGEPLNVIFGNKPLANLTILKRDAKGSPLSGAQFLVTDQKGLPIGPSDGHYTTGSNGQVTVTGIQPDTAITVREEKAPAGYVLNTEPQTITVRSNEDNTLTFVNGRKGTLVVIKVDEETGTPLAGAEFKVTTAGSTLVADQEGAVSSNGVYVSDRNGTFTITGLEPGGYVITETKAPDGYVLNAEPVTVEVTENDTQTIRIKNTPLNSLIIQKYEGDTTTPIQGVTFLVTDDNGAPIGTTEGEFVTDANGRIVVNGLTPGMSVTAREIKVPDAYVLDGTPKSVKIKEGASQTLTFRNVKKGALIIAKKDKLNGAPLAGAEFQLTYDDGSFLDTGGHTKGVYTTDRNGEIRITGLTGSITAKETKAADGYVIDQTAQTQTVTVNPQETKTLTFYNEPLCSLTVTKVDSVTKKPVPNTEFAVKDSNGNELGRYTTGPDGTVTITGLTPGAVYVVTETKVPSGYVLNTTPHVFTAKNGSNTLNGSAGTVTPPNIGINSGLTVENDPKMTLTIKKYIEGTDHEPLPGVSFRVTDGSGAAIGGGDGIFRTDKAGSIVIEGLEPGTTVIAQEIKTVEGYVLNGTPKSLKIEAGEKSPELVFWNQKAGELVIRKLDKLTGKPLAGVEFELTYADGGYVDNANGHLSSKGLYTTNEKGEIRITGVTGTIVAKETKTIPGYTIDPGTQSQTVVVNPADTQTLTFYNTPGTTLTIQKYIDGTTDPLAGVTFLVTDSSGAVLGPNSGEFVTDENGRIVIENLVPGETITAKEIRTVDGYVLDSAPKSVKIKEGEGQQMMFTNKRAGTLVIEKLDSVTNAPLTGAQFQITYTNGAYLDIDNGHLSGDGIYTTDEQGEIRISSLTGTFLAKEVKAAPGYVIDNNSRSQTVTVKPNETKKVTFHNEPLCSLTLTKLDSVSGKPVPNTQFAVKDGNGNVIGQYTTGKDGTVTVTGLIPGAAYVVSEMKVPNGYVLNSAPQTIVVKNGANTLSGGGTIGTIGESAGTGGITGTGGNGLTFENDPKMTLTIRKYIEGTANEPLSGVSFKVTDSSGAPVGGGDGIFYTDKTGSIVIEGLEPGTTVTAQEVKTVDGFVLDGTPKSVKIQAGEKAPELVFWNQKAGELVIRKLDKFTGKPLAGVEFELTYADGGYVDNANGHLSSKGLYTTNEKGEIRITGVTGTIVAKETKTIPGYTIDPGTQSQTVVVNPADTQTLTFYNTPGTTLTIQKYVDGTTTPIQGVTFLVTDSSGTVLGPNNGEYVTDKNGRIVINNLVPGVTITAKETKTAGGYVLDSTPQSILIKEGEAQSMTFYNKSEGGLELIKVSASDKSRRIPDTTFEIRKKDGGLVETVTTGKNGSVHVDLDAGDYYAVEIEAAQGFELDETPRYFTVEDGRTTTLTVTNKALSGILIHKTNSVTGKGIQGVTFLLYDSTNTPVGQYTSDDSGYVYIENLTTTGRYYLRELENEGYVPDNQMKTVYVTAGETTLVEWKNIPITAQIQIIKRSADYNPTNGLPAGTLLEGAVFEIYDKANNLVDTIKSDQRGLAASNPLPLGRYTIREVKAPANYGVSDTVLNAYLEHEGQIVTFEVTDKSLATGVNITKTGPKEAMAGQPVRYQFSGIANRSNVRLDSFYWRDTLPAQIQLEQVVTGTYNFPGTYKITYRVNGGEPRTLADSLSTSQNYTLAASPTALGLAANERVTEIMFVFGQAPAGFAQVETPYIFCTALRSLKGGTSFVNVADVGGAYNGVWVQGVSRWVTSVYGKSYPLPKTGY